MFRHFKFDLGTILTNKRKVNLIAGSAAPEYDTLATNNHAGSFNIPWLDSGMKKWGTASLRFDVQVQDDASSGGYWYSCFSPDGLLRFGPNSQFFIQWRQRMDAAFINNVYLDTSGAPTGSKQIDITAADVPAGVTPAFPNGHIYGSCAGVEIVVERYGGHPLPRGYNECGKYDGFYQAFPNVGSGDFLIQNALTTCLFSKLKALSGSTPFLGCFCYVPDNWMHFQVGITLGARDRINRRFLNSRFQMWAGYEGLAPELIADWSKSVPGGFDLCDGDPNDPQFIGKIYLLPYMTRRDSTKTYPPATTWYDGLIMSTQRIPDPTV